MSFVFVFFFNDTATTEIYTLSLHDALPIFDDGIDVVPPGVAVQHADDRELQLLVEPLEEPPDAARRLAGAVGQDAVVLLDRKSTRLNSSHANISYAVFCLKKKKDNMPQSPG